MANHKTRGPEIDPQKDPQASELFKRVGEIEDMRGTEWDLNNLSAMAKNLEGLETTLQKTKNPDEAARLTEEIRQKKEIIEINKRNRKIDLGGKEKAA